MIFIFVSNVVVIFVSLVFDVFFFFFLMGSCFVSLVVVCIVLGFRQGHGGIYVHACGMCCMYVACVYAWHVCMYVACVVLPLSSSAL